MKLLVIRHARAESAKEFARQNANDDLRPLTDDGRERMRLAALGLHQLVEEIDLLASSALVRARQTADIIRAEFAAPEIMEIATLRPDADPAAFGEWLRSAGALETIAIVGHDAHLSQLVGWFLTGESERLVKIKKGGAVMLELNPHEAQLRPPATLLWALTPRQLRMLGSAASLPQGSADVQRAQQ